MVKRGLGDPYSRTVISEKIRAYADLTKPASSIAIMLTVPFSAIIYSELNGHNSTTFLLTRWADIVYASVTLLLLHGGSQSLNHAEDAYMDREAEHKSNRPIPSGVVSEEEARSLAWIFIGFGVARAFTINTQFGIFSTILASMGVFYNLSPIRAKERLWVNVIWQAASRGLILYPATFAVWGDGNNHISWALGVLSFLLVLSLQQTADFADVEVDAKFDIITPAVYHGLDELTSIMTSIIIIMFVVMSAFIWLGIIPMLWSLYILLIPIGWSLHYLWKYPNDISSIGGNSPTWYVFYLSLAGMYILPAIQLTFF